MEQAKLSLCMIVKNEGASIGRCLASIQGIVDQIVVVDTGSDDDTIAIARQFGAEVYSFAWSGSFADARNYSLSKASGDWICWLDADEEVDAEDGPRLREVLQWEDEKLGFIELVNYYGPTPPSLDRVYRFGHHRLFRNHSGFQFHGAIHEQLNVEEFIPVLTEKRFVPVKIYHYGYLDDVVKQKGKGARNLGMLEIAVADAPHDPWLHYHLASEYYRAEQYPAAFAAINQSIVMFLRQQLTPPSMVYIMKYAVMLAYGSHDGAWPAINKAIEMYPDYVDLHYYKGLILYAKGWHEEARAAFETCLQLGEGNLEYLSMDGLGTYRALHMRAQCDEQLGNREAAIAGYRSALELSPSFEAAAEALAQATRTEQGGENPANGND